MLEQADEMGAIMDAVGILQAGDRAAARISLLRMWDELSGSGTPVQRCTIAHFLADTEEGVEAELAWDLLALEAATGLENGGDPDAVAPGLASFLPSLHLNAGDAYRRLGDHDRARSHARFGLNRIAAVPSGGYRDMMKAGLERLVARLSESDPG